MNLLILSCSQSKRPDAGLMPAYERYDGPAYKVFRCWERQNPYWETALSIWILSGKYGLISSDVQIADYDQRMTEAFATRLRSGLTAALRCITPPRRCFISLGATYRLALPDTLPFPAQMAQGGIGQRLTQLKAWLGEVGQ
jgi:hypothetical protein